MASISGAIIPINPYLCPPAFGDTVLLAPLWALRKTVVRLPQKTLFFWGCAGTGIMLCCSPWTLHPNEAQNHQLYVFHLYS